MELGGIALALGHTADAQKHFRVAEAIHDPSQHRSSVAAFGLDIGVFARIWATHLHWYEGEPERARLKAGSALKIADNTGHPFTRTIALAYAAMLAQFRGDIDEVDRLTAAIIADAEAHGFPYYLSWARVLRGWSLAARDGDPAAPGSDCAAFEDARATGEARQCFRTAIEIARSQGAKSLELKAVASLSGLRPRRTRCF